MKFLKSLFFLCGVAIALSAEVITITSDQARKIGMQIWQNECNRTVAGLTSWHSNEKFPSLGIGHFIWFPREARESFEESFPRFINFARKKKISVPSWLIVRGKVIACPWKTKSEFEKDFNTQKLKELRQFLVDTIELQIRFIMDGFKQAFDTIFKHGPKRKTAHVRRQFRFMASSPNGLYALIDYLNFKGSGIKDSERYNGQSWGLYQVLSGMHAEHSGDKVVEAFVESAKKVLENRIAHAPKEKHEERFMPGWNNRLSTYLNPL